MKKTGVIKNSVLFLCQFFYPENVSSATLPYDTALALVDDGFHVGVLCGYPKEYHQNKEEKVAKNEVVNGIRIKRLKYKTFSKKSKLGRIINYFGFTFKCFLNLRNIQKYEYLIVYSNPPILPYIAYLASKKFGTKIIFVSYDVYPEIAIKTNSISEKGLVYRVMNSINKRLYSRVYKVVALSDDMRRFLTKTRPINPNAISVIPNWNNVEKDEFYPPKRTNVFVASYFGNVGICQDIDTILMAAELLREDETIKFVIGGRGNRMERVYQYVETHELKNVEIKPFLVGEEYEEAMKNSDCFLLSLEKNITELCYPSKYYSYLNFGRPVYAIMDDCELAHEIKEGGFGFAFANGDSVGLAKSIKEMSMFSKQKYHSFCMRAYSRYLTFYKKTNSCEKYINLFKGGGPDNGD